MWFATGNGLTRYDGYQFTVYRHDPADPTTLSSDNVRAIYEDRSGELWVGTMNGLDRLDRTSGTFTHYLSGRSILTLYEDKGGILWVATLWGLTRLAPADPVPSYYIGGTLLDDPKKLSGTLVWAICEDQEGELWLGTGPGAMLGAGGLDRFDRIAETFVHYRPNPDDPTSLGDNEVWAIFEDRQGVLWIGTSEGLNRLDRASQTFVRYQHDPDDPHSLGDDRVLAILEDNAGRLWIGTANGLEQLDRNQNRFVHYRHDPYDLHSLGNDVVLSIYEDRSGVLWIGTNGGISKYDQTASQFTLYQQRPDSANSLSDSAVLAMCEDQSGTLWIGTAEGGLNRLDRSSGTFTIYQHDPADPTSLSSDGVLAIYEDREGTLWVGTDDRWLEQFDPQTETFVHYRYLSAGAARVITEDRAGNLWISTENGLYRLDRATETSTYYYYSSLVVDPTLSHNYVTAICELQAGNLMVGTNGGGINVWDPVEERFTYTRHDPDNPNSLSHDSVFSVSEDQDEGVVWIGTWKGLDRFDQATETVTHYTEEDGLPSNAVIGILSDSAGFLWLSTQWGLSRFDPRTETFRNFDARDGLQSGRFYWTARFQSERGEMFFGGANGFNAFYPERIPENPHPPPIAITAFSLFNEVVRRDLPANEHIELSYEDNFISFEFAALDYTAPEKNHYAYMMEKVDQDWVYAGTRRRAGYTDLRPGNYVFRVKGSNNDGVWNEEGMAVYITVTPPLWETWWFRGIVALALLGSAIGAYHLRVRSLAARSRELERQVAQRTAELRQEMDQRMQAEKALRQSEAEKAVADERNRLARDLHDSVTQSLYSLTLLTEAGQRLAKAGDLERVQGYQARIGEIGQQVLNEMRLLVHELRPLALESEGLVGALRQRLDAVEQRVGIEAHLVLVGEAGTTKLPPTVEEELFRIAQEALNNALKHAVPTSVEVRIRVEGDDTARCVELEVRDNGQGFDLDVVSDKGGMGLMSMRERAEKLGGTLTILSTPGEGTRVKASMGAPTNFHEQTEVAK